MEIVLVVKMKIFTAKKSILLILIIILINNIMFAQNINCGYTLKPPRRADIVGLKNKKNRFVPY